ncbi:DUF805 domain-containing protein [Brevundimonas aveniformis]|uniref:DUF805 domain-containing protein n=1 Tax=Brevundimonas aveniformis TaxID=370977 RepID=UPI00248F6EFD|nr:DUF805 domain-containing protein [Brevundimonas aveniformis]
MRFLAYLFSFQGRFTAGDLWHHGFALAFPTLTVFAGATAALWQISSGALLYGFGVALLFQWTGQISATVRRFHDFGLSGWWALTMLIAPACVVALFLEIFAGLPSQFASVVPSIAFGMFVISACALLALFVMPGQRRDNRFGPIPDGRPLADR